MRISDWSSDVCSSDLLDLPPVIPVTDLSVPSPVLNLGHIGRRESDTENCWYRSSENQLIVTHFTEIIHRQGEPAPEHIQVQADIGRSLLFPGHIIVPQITLKDADDIGIFIGGCFSK